MLPLDAVTTRVAAAPPTADRIPVPSAGDTTSPVR
jgi:hypothetical protein